MDGVLLVVMGRPPPIKLMHGGFLMSGIGSSPRSTEALLQSFGLVRFQKILTPQEFTTAAERTGCVPKRKEVHAQLLLSNVVRWIMTEASEDEPLTPLDFSFLTTLTLIKDRVSTFIHAHPRDMTKLYRQLLRDIRAARIRKRPGRSYPRPGDRRIKNKGRGYYQAPARILKN